MICPNCGAKMDSDSEFCDQCGVPLRGGAKRKKRSRLPLILIMLFLIFAAVGSVAVWVLIDESHSTVEVKQQYEAFKEEQKRAEQSGIQEQEQSEDANMQESLSADKTSSATDSEEEIEEDIAEQATDVYILPESDSRYMTDADVENLSLKEINYAKNEIYARHGRKFDSVELQNYFNSKSWYDEKYEPEDFDKNHAGELNDYEKTNAEFLSEKEFSINPDGYKLDAN